MKVDVSVPGAGSVHARWLAHARIAWRAATERCGSWAPPRSARGQTSKGLSHPIADIEWVLEENLLPRADADRLAISQPRRRWQALMAA